MSNKNDESMFEIGDEVIFECGAAQRNRPRYQFNDDLGSTDLWARGYICHIDNKIIQVKYTIEGFVGKGHCTWPNVDHEDYDPLQWCQEGYLQIAKKIGKLKCECGSEKTYGANAFHSDWCPKYE